jgi:hypothetical protein
MGTQVEASTQRTKGPRAGDAPLVLAFGDFDRASLPVAGARRPTWASWPAPGCRCCPASASPRRPTRPSPRGRAGVSSGGVHRDARRRPGAPGGTRRRRADGAAGRAGPARRGGGARRGVRVARGRRTGGGGGRRRAAPEPVAPVGRENRWCCCMGMGRPHAHARRRVASTPAARMYAVIQLARRPGHGANGAANGRAHSLATAPSGCGVSRQAR